VNEAKRTVVLGLVFLLCLALAYIENVSFFNYLRDAFSSPPLAVLLFFLSTTYWQFRLFWLA